MSVNSKAQQQVQQAAKALHKLAGPARWQLQAVLGETAVAQASLGVRYGRDPYGSTWAPLTSRSGRPLRRTGNNIQRGWNARAASSDTFVFGSRFKYLRTHQYGAVIVPKATNKRGMLRYRMFGRVVYARKSVIPQRQMIPEMSTGGLGRRWTNAFSRTIKTWLIRTTHFDI